MKIKSLLIVLATVVSPMLVSCGGDSNAQALPPTVVFTVVGSGSYNLGGSAENRKIEVFTDQASFNSSLYKYIQPIKEHTVDFSSRRVVLLSLGTRSTGGYSVTIESIEDFGDFIRAEVLIKKPGSNCIVTQAVTSPYAFIEIQSTKDLIFEERVEVQRC